MATVSWIPAQSDPGVADLGLPSAGSGPSVSSLGPDKLITAFARSSGGLTVQTWDVPFAGIQMPSATLATTTNISTVVNDRPAVALLSDGSAVVVWANWTAGSVLAQRFSSAGTLLGTPFTLSSGSIAASAIKISAMADGSFVASWEQPVATGEGVIAVRVFSSNGVAALSTIDRDNDGNDLNLDILALQNGAVLQSTLNTDAPPANGSAGSYAHLAQSPLLNVGIFSADPIIPETAMPMAQLPNGQTVSVLSVKHSGAPNISFRLGDSNGAGVGPVRTITSPDVGALISKADVITFEDSSFLIVWLAELGPDWIIRGAYFDSTGAARGAPVSLGKGTGSAPVTVAVTSIGEGRYAVAFDGQPVSSGIAFDLFQIMRTTLLSDAGETVGYSDHVRDYVEGGAGNDFIDSGDGHDIVQAVRGDDTIYGRGGRDWINGYIGRDWIDGGEGNDTILGGSDGDTLYGGAGNDTVEGGAGNDYLEGGIGVDTISGGFGNDVFYVRATRDETDLLVETAGEGTDLVVTNVTSYTLADQIENLGVLNLNLQYELTGNNVANTISGGNLGDRQSGLNGNDTLLGSNGPDTLNGGSGMDTVDYSRSLAAVTVDLDNSAVNAGGMAAGDVFGGTVRFGELVETVEIVIGSRFGDRLFGQDRVEVRLGFELPPIFYTVQQGMNRLEGGGGNDTLDGGSGNDTLIGGAGNDLIFVDTQADVVVETSTGGTLDTVRASASYALGEGVFVELLETTNGNLTTAIHLTGNSHANIVRGNAGGNTLRGGAGNDQLFGNSGNDSLDGGAENDTIAGQNGSDTLDGGAGNDTLIGGADDDVFLFDDALSAANVDTIQDFSTLADLIYLDRSVFASLQPVGVPAPLLASAFQINTTGLAQDADDRIIYNSATGALFYDSNGSGVGGVTFQFAVLANSPAGLSAGDFIVVA